jgi:hypothetical protein
MLHDGGERRFTGYRCGERTVSFFDSIFLSKKQRAKSERLISGHFLTLFNRRCFDDWHLGHVISKARHNLSGSLSSSSIHRCGYGWVMPSMPTSTNQPDSRMDILNNCVERSISSSWRQGLEWTGPMMTTITDSTTPAERDSPPQTHVLKPMQIRAETTIVFQF